MPRCRSVGDPPPLPHQPRKGLLELALAGLAAPVDCETLAALRGALTSPDSSRAHVGHRRSRTDGAGRG